MRVYEIEAFEDASRALFGISPTDKQIKEMVQSVRATEETYKGLTMYLLDVHKVIAVTTIENFNDILPEFKSCLPYKLKRLKNGKDILFSRGVIDTTGEAYNKRFEGVYVCGSYIFTTRTIIEEIQNTQRRKKREDLEAAIRKEREAEERLYRINTKDHIAPLKVKKADIWGSPKNEEWQKNIKRTRKLLF